MLSTTTDAELVQLLENQLPSGNTATVYTALKNSYGF